MDEPVPAGHHYVTVNVTYQAIKGHADVSEMDWKSKDATGQTDNIYYLLDSATPNRLSDTTLTAPNLQRGNVYLAVPDGQPATVVYSTVFDEAASWTVPGSAS